MLAAVALSIILGLIAGLPLLSQKNGLGLLVVFIVAFVSIYAMSVLAKADPYAQMDEQVSRVRGTHRRLLGTFVWSIIGGAAIGVSYGVIGQTLSPMHPLDVSPTFIALAFIGAIGGFTVGMVLVFGMIFFDRGSQPRK